MKKQNRDVTRSYTLKQFSAKLRRFLESAGQGETFRIQVAGKRVNVPKNATCSIEHERDGESEELEFQITWKR